MKKYKFLLRPLLIGVLSIFSFTAFSIENKSVNLDPAGFWKTFEKDENGKKVATSVIQIWKESNGEYKGKIIKIEPVLGQKPDDTLCRNCKSKCSKEENKPILNLVIMHDMKPNKDNPLKWTKGHVFDPKNCKTYQGYMELNPEGTRLKLRGYVLGIPLLGRTETWERTTNPDLLGPIKSSMHFKK